MGTRCQQLKEPSKQTPASPKLTSPQTSKYTNTLPTPYVVKIIIIVTTTIIIIEEKTTKEQSPRL